VLDDVPVGEACPACGSTRRNAHVRAEAILAVTAISRPGIRIDYNPSRPWYEKWHDVRQHLDALEAVCRPGAYQGNDPVVRSFKTFFTECFHLGDWLWDDPASGLSEQAVQQFILGDPALRICEGMANTNKHHSRRKAVYVTARISSVTSDEKGTQAFVGWSQGQQSGTEDALDLARRCFAAWEAYLRLNGLQSSI
jgi:hypothetical protein